MYKKLRKIHMNLKDKIKDKRIKGFKFLFDKKKVKADLKNIKKNKILFLRHDGKIGDMIISTMMYREIKKNNPNITIGVITRENTFDLIKNNPYIDNIYIYKKKYKYIKKIAGDISKVNYDVLIDFGDGISEKTIYLLNKIQAKVNIGFMKKDYKIFDISLDEKELNEHITNRYKKVLNFLGFEVSSYKYDIFENRSNDKIKLIKKNSVGEKTICINRFGASKHRTLSENNMLEIIYGILKLNKNIKILLLTPSNKKSLNKRVIDKIGDEKVKLIESENIMNAIEIMKKVDLIVTPDTSIIHIASALQKPLVGIYRKGNAMKCWGPKGTNYKIVTSNSKDEINELETDKVVENIKKILQEI
ncbi:glycosyltransferase family 9 protein [Haliovirga abyssi]|uniref:LOS biosynthesis enzyme LBGB n=1 Tax=Haliovirga abyssi TaxID=2996794 RepID=A0AAU9DUL8_9FUSO|nr:glycosyltransferase family 9 protein [Haliovirga abyssi]BDU49681.1 LOS biosynthesis enzyme LBGB [Haliovirga abyssi]